MLTSGQHRTPRRTIRLRIIATAMAVGLLGLIHAPAAFATPGSAHPSGKPFPVRVISFNDLHGNLEPPTGSSGRTIDDTGATVDAGGIAYLAAHLKQQRAAAADSFVVSAGDNIGASPLISAAFHDEPTIAALNQLGLTASAVGNHELDEGYTELKRIQLGGCHPVDGCQYVTPYKGARFPFLGANITLKRNGLPAVLPFTIKTVNGVPIGIIGITLEDLPSVVTAEGIASLKFGDEVQAINRTANLLDRFGIKAQIVVMHQGDSIAPGSPPNSCRVVPGIAQTIAQAATPKVDAFFAGHSHQQYNCSVNDPNGNPRPIVQASSFGRVLSVVDLTINPRTRDVVRSETKANNVVVTRTITPDPAMAALVEDAKERIAPVANRPIGTVTADLNRIAAPSGETALGDVIADAQLAATSASGAQIAMTNPGGIRTDITYAGSPAGEGDGVVTYGEAFSVQPFSNILQTMTLTGAQLDAVLEQQRTAARSITLQVSANLHFTITPSNAFGDQVSNITIDGVPVDPGTDYRVTVNNFLGGGGDGFTGFRDGTNVVNGSDDLVAFAAYLTANSPVSPPALNRITLG